MLKRTGGARVLGIAFAMVSCFCGSLFAEPEAYYVDASRPDDSGDGTSWATAKKTIQAAVDLSESLSNGRVPVIVTNGIYEAVTRVTPGHLSLNRLVITKDVEVFSVNGPKVTFIQGHWSSSACCDVGSNAVRCVFMSAGTLEGFSLINGYTMDSGSATYDQAGGGVNMYGGSGVVTNCIFDANTAVYGGGCYGGTVNNCTLKDNIAKYGGASSGSTLNNCEIFRNRAYNEGGASSGGTLNNCKIIGNRSFADGGGTSCATLKNCSVCNNSADNEAGGCINSTLSNCIIYYNEADNYSNCKNCAVTYSCTAFPVMPGAGNIPNSPSFVDMANGNYRLMAKSPCINSGTNSSAPMPYDLAGSERIYGGSVDMGAYEWHPAIDNDYNGDGASDLAVLDQATGRWFVRRVGGGQVAFNINWGWPGVEPVAGDYDGDGTDDLAVFDQNTGRWFIRSISGTTIGWNINWGWPGVRPVSGDYDGDGKADLAVFDQNTGRWFIRSVSGATIGWNVNWGWPGVDPVSGDFDGDGVSDPAIFDQNTGRWFIRSVSGTTIGWNINWGWPGVQPVGK